jgi:hypothetical protein
MKPEEHTAIIQRIRASLNDEAAVTELLTTLSEDYGSVTTEVNTTKQTADQLKADNDKLRECNMKLFLKVGNPAPENNNGSGQQGNENKKLSFDALFDEKGKLK